MADFVVGLGKAAADATVMKVKSALEEEEKLKKSVQRDLILISDEFQMMNSFLSMAKDHVTDDVMRTLVRQIRSTALDVEDSIEILVHLDNKKRWFLRILPRCCIWGSAVALNDAVAGIELLKARVEAMGQRNMSYSQIISAIASSNKPAKQMHQLQQAGSNTASNAHVGVWDASVDHSAYLFLNKDEASNVEDRKAAARAWLDSHQLVGREMDKWNILLHAIIGRDDVPVVSVWGMAGVGKSSLVKDAYFTEMLEPRRSDMADKFYKFAWMDVSHPINLVDLSWIRTLLLDLNLDSESHQHSSTQDPKDLIQECREILRNHKSLVVLEGIQSIEQWDSIKAALLGFGSSSSGQSRIVVITNEESVGKYCTLPSACINVKGLQVDEALELFKNKVPASIRSPALSDPVVEKAIMNILHRCGGIPKVIVAIADYLSKSRDTSPGGILERLEWLSPRFMYSLENDTEFRSLQDLFAWLHSYFGSRPDFLKPCIFYLSIFTGDDRIRRRRLLRRWIAEGYSTDSKERTAEETAEYYFSMLEEFTVILRHDSTPLVGFTTTRKMPLCQVSGLYREYITSRSMEENLVFVLKGHCSMNSGRTGRHLVIEKSWDRNRDVYEAIDFSRLRSLTVFGGWQSFFISDKMRVLRVVDLEGVSKNDDGPGVTDADLVQMVKLLPSLKFLSLRGCKEITRLPDSLGGLKQLQTLDVRHTSVAMLPPSIVKLKKLQYIRAGTRPAPDAQPDSSVEVPKHIGNLTAMNTLGVVAVRVAEGKAILKELKKLTQLHKLGVSGINRNNRKEFFTAIRGHEHLESLSVGVDEESCLDDVDESLAPVNLWSLKLYGLERRLPGWTKKLVNLRKLSLQMIKLPQAGLDFLLRDLPKLVCLRLFLSEFDDDMLHFGGQDNRFFLEFLEISCNSSLQAITFPEYTLLPSDVVVKVLRIRCYDVSTLQISGIRSLGGLKEIWLRGDYNDTFKEHLESELANYPEAKGKPVLRLEGSSSSIPYLMTSA